MWRRFDLIWREPQRAMDGVLRSLSGSRVVRTVAAQPERSLRHRRPRTDVHLQRCGVAARHFLPAVRPATRGRCASQRIRSRTGLGVAAVEVVFLKRRKAGDMMPTIEISAGLRHLERRRSCPVHYRFDGSKDRGMKMTVGCDHAFIAHEQTPGPEVKAPPAQIGHPSASLLDDE